MTKLNPGDNAPRTGTYSILDAKGKKIGSVEVQRGNRMPPTQSSEYYYQFER